MFRKNNIGVLTSRAAALLFLLSYAATFILSQFHQLSHFSHHEEVVCYLEDDACHLRLAHFDSENGCDHESHITDRQPSCELCPLLQAKNEANGQTWKLLLPETVSGFEVGLEVLAKNQNHPLDLTNRGPPENS